MTDPRTLFDAGLLDEAAEACRTRLARDAGDLVSLHLLGKILLQQGAVAEAVSLLSVVAGQLTDPAVMNELGEALNVAGMPDEAALRFRAAIALHPSFALPYYNLGCLLLARGEHTEAIALLRQAVTLQPEFTEAWLGLGNGLLACNEPSEAAHCYRAAIALRSDYVEALNNLGNALSARHQPKDAADSFRAALQHRSDLPELWLGLGNALLESGDAEASEQAFRAAIDLRPNYTEALNGLGNALLARRRADDAAAIYRTALVHRPESPELWLGLGNALLESADAGESERCFRAALTAQPDYAAAAASLAKALLAQHRLDEAFAAFRIALRVDPANAGNRNDYALALLLGGRFAEGWREHEVRRSLDRMRPNYERRPALPQWHEGMALEGRCVLLMLEQGFGDFVQFVRYAPMLARRAALVVAEMPRELQPVFATLPGIARAIGRDDPAPDCDIGCPLLSLPLYFGTTLASIPAAVPYASVLPERLALWRDWLGPRRGRRIGLVCSGRPTYALDRHRSMPLACLARLFDVPDSDFFLLQPDVRESDKAALAAQPMLRQPGPLLRDFADTAALLAEMDLVVTVDSAIAHLAGALARPVWLMLPFVPDYRWMLHRRDSPWYPTMTLYRQQRRGDWVAVIEAVRRDLCAA